MNIVFLKLYVTNEVNSAFYNSQEIGLAKALVKLHPEHHVDVVMLSRNVTAEKKTDIGNGIMIHVLPGKGFGHHGRIDLRILKELKTDLVHLLADNMMFAPNVICYCKKNGIKCHLYIGTLFTDSNNGFKQSVGRILIGRNIKAYKTVPAYAKTPYVKRQLNEFGVHARLAPVGIDVMKLNTYKIDVEALRAKYGLPLGKKVLLFVGRFEEYKRPVEAVELLKLLIKLDDSPNGYHLLMIGDGVLADEVRSAICSEKLDEKVTLVSQVPNSEMSEIYKSCDVFVNFNRVEIYGMAILEAFANGCPVVAMNAPGPEFLIDDARTGYLCGSLEDMATKVSFLTEDKGLREVIVAAARKHVEENLTWERCVEAFEDWN